MQPLPSVAALISQFAAHGILLAQGAVRVDGYKYAAIEGEGDGSLEYWRKGH